MVSVDEPLEEKGPALGDLLSADESCEPGRKYVEQGARDDLFKKACEFASPLESLVLDLKANGLSISEIAEQLNKTPDQISKALYKCRKKLEEHRGVLL